MRGKEKCKALKEIRKQIADQNDIPFAISQCTHKGDCKGTCPKCEEELKYLERELAIRQGLGKAIAVVGISVGICTSLTACNPVRPITDFFDYITGNQLEGDTTATERVMPLPLEGDMYAPEDDIQSEGTDIDPIDNTSDETNGDE